MIKRASVIPDAITPIEGWKSVGISDDGTILSSHQETPWPGYQPLHAQCTAQQENWELISIDSQEGRTKKQFKKDIKDDAEYHHERRHSYEPPRIYTPAGHTSLKPPRIIPPGRMEWRAVWRPRHPQTSIPSTDCSCGIYLANAKGTAEEYGRYCNYRDRQFVTAVFYGWGKTIVYEGGWRVEYAYPKELHLEDEHLAIKIAERYGINVYTTTLKECVFCGGDAHPAECGLPETHSVQTTKASKRSLANKFLGL